jgi:hypothetical protein
LYNFFLQEHVAVVDAEDAAVANFPDLTDFSVDEWEPSIDKALWQSEKRLNIYVQRAAQGDGEQVTALPPQPIYILEP